MESGDHRRWERFIQRSSFGHQAYKQNYRIDENCGNKRNFTKDDVQEKI